MSESDGGYLEHLMSLFRSGDKARADVEGVRQDAPGQPKVQPATQPALEPKSQDPDRQAFEESLKTIAARREPSDAVVAGKVHLIHLDKVRQRMGAKWPRYADRVHGHIKAELKNRLTQHDHFTQVNADTYAVVFGGCLEMEARLKMALLAEQILEKLFGEAEAKDLDILGVETLVTQADGRVASEALESVESLVELLDQAEVTDLDPNTHRYRAAANGERSLTPQEVAELLGEVDNHLKASKECPGGSGSIEFRVDRLRGLVRHLECLEGLIAAQDQSPGSEPPHRRGFDPCAWAEIKKPSLEAIRQIKSRAEQQIAFVYEQEPTSETNSADEDALVGIEFRYVPMWHALTRKAGIYLCQADIDMPGGDAWQASSDAPYVEAEILGIIDRLTLRRARQDLQESHALAHLNIVAVPIHFSTLDRHGSRRRMVELCSNIPEELRNLLIWEIRGAHVDTWGSRLAEIAGPIQQFGRAVFLQLDGAQDNYHEIRRNLRHLRPAGIREIGLDVRRLPGPETVQFGFLERLAADATAHGLRCYGHGFESMSLTICAVGLGFQHVSGPAVAEPTARPAGIQPTSLDAIYSRTIDQRP